MGNTTYIRRTGRALLAIGGYSESRTPTIDDQTLNHSLTLASPAHTLTTPMFRSSESQDSDTNLNSISLLEGPIVGNRSAVTAMMSIMEDENESQDNVP